MRAPATSFGLTVIVPIMSNDTLADVTNAQQAVTASLGSSEGALNLTFTNIELVALSFTVSASETNPLNNTVTSSSTISGGGGFVYSISSTSSGSSSSADVNPSFVDRPSPAKSMTNGEFIGMMIGIGVGVLGLSTTIAIKIIKKRRANAWY